MSLIQKIISIILYAGHTSKQVCTLHLLRYDTLCNITLKGVYKASKTEYHSTVIRTLSQLGSNHDIKVKKWKANLQKELTEVIKPV